MFTNITTGIGIVNLTDIGALMAIDIDINRLKFNMIDIEYTDGVVQDCGNSSALAMELLKCCTKPSLWYN